MMYLTGFLNHAASVRAAAAELGLRAHVDVNDMSLSITDGAHTHHWRARFVGATESGSTAYFDQWGANTLGFAGWLPYPTRSWHTSTDKIAFKTWALEHDIATPAACIAPDRIGGPFLIKKGRSSFGEGIRGPFRSYDPTDPRHQLADGEYYENFILGHIVKAWYWGGTWGAVEFRRPPVAVGDGQSTLRALAQAKPKTGGREDDWDSLETLARFCGLGSVDDVPAAGREVLIDFKYASRYEPMQRENRNTIHQIRQTPLAPQFEQAGRVFTQSVKEFADENVLFTLDAMVDSEGTVWFLEMNSNPMVHPDMYWIILRDQFRAACGTVAQEDAPAEA